MDNLNPELLDITDSCRILFSEDEDDAALIDKLDINALKSAYRSRVLESHPDRAEQLGLSREILNEKFIEVENAYSNVLDFLNKKADEQVPDYSESFSNGAAYYGQTILPNIRILTGQYLLYSGRINISELLEAIRWQRQMRPLFGEIAVDGLYMTDSDVNKVLSSRNLSEKFGQCSLRLGMINSFQYRTIIERQKNLQKPIGEYFIEKGNMSRAELNSFLVELEVHNMRADKKKITK